MNTPLRNTKGLLTSLLFISLGQKIIAQDRKYTVGYSQIGACTGKKVVISSNQTAFCLRETDVVNIRQGTLTLFPNINRVGDIICDLQREDRCLAATEHTKLYYRVNDVGDLSRLTGYDVKAIIPNVLNETDETAIFSYFSKAAWIEATSYVLLGGSLENGLYRFENTPVISGNVEQFYGHLGLDQISQSPKNISDIMMIDGTNFCVLGAIYQSNATVVDVTRMIPISSETITSKTNSFEFEKFFANVELGLSDRFFVVASHDLRLVKVDLMMVEAVEEINMAGNFLAVTSFHQSDVVVAVSRDHLVFYRLSFNTDADQPGLFTKLIQEDFIDTDLAYVTYSKQAKKLILIHDQKAFYLDFTFLSEAEKSCHRNCDDCLKPFNYRLDTDCISCGPSSVSSDLYSPDIPFCLDTSVRKTSYQIQNSLFNLSRNAIATINDDKKDEQIVEPPVAINKNLWLLMILGGILLYIFIFMFGMVRNNLS